MCPVVIFSLADQEYCLDVLDVQEVIRMVKVTPLPEAPSEILGVINVRGVPTLVLDLRQRLRLPHRPPTLISPLLIVKVHNTKLAVLVDRVIGVTQETTLPSNAGIVRVGDRLVVMLRPDNLPSEQTSPLLTGLPATE
jgi:chemotaxis signal transduction protein